ncbi:ABC transporter substrate-binding protein [Thalassomonas actiniarum]|uniref:Uncharacterized protein n=1 Tax=Thalassomonas actiniarum TaxID=485447 RepID=A0AAE9YNR2_9GAMM|nr:hypothetical protein [Thalassomonas actiniarum]WDD98067.1 hypothetical protein SG35_022715 [Thalassomonas actiniarum]
MIAKINDLLKIIFFLLLSVCLIWQSLQRPRVLVVQSYANDFSWTREIDNAISRTLAPWHYEVRHFYMDTKKRSSDKFKKQAARRVKKQIDNWSPDVVIAVDDNAQSLVSGCYVNVEALDPAEVVKLKQRLPALGECYRRHSTMKIVFAGVGAEPKDYGFSGQGHIGGILDPVDAKFLSLSLQEVKNQLAKEQLKIIAPVDDSVTSAYNLKHSLRELARELKPLAIDIEYPVMVTLADWQQQIQQASRQGDLLLFTLYHTVRCRADKGSRRIAPRDLIRWTLANSKIPAIGTYGFFVEDGGYFALGVSPLEQGSEAAKMAVDYLELGILPGEQAVRTTHQSIVYMREHRAEKQGFDLPVVYRNFARATGNYLKGCQQKKGACRTTRVPDLDLYCRS